MSTAKLERKIQAQKEEITNLGRGKRQLEQEKQQLEQEKQQLEQRKQWLQKRTVRLKRDKVELQHEKEQHMKANELMRRELSELMKNRLGPCRSAVSPQVAPALNRERVRAMAESLRATEQSRHDISKRALDLLHESHRAQHHTKLETKRREIASTEAKLETAATNLATKHSKEMAESQAAKLALFHELDAMREAWSAGSKVDAKELLLEEGVKYASLIESLKAKHLRDEETAQKALEGNLKRLQKSEQNSFWWDSQSQSYRQVIDPTITQATASRNERQRAHDQLLTTYEVDWKARQLELQRQISRGKPQIEDRIKFEDEYQIRLSGLVHDWDVIQQRQIEELGALADERSVALAAVMRIHQDAESEVKEERRMVEEWGTHIFNQMATCQRQIDEDEQDALREIDRLDTAAMVEIEAGTEGIASPFTGPTSYFSELQPAAETGDADWPDLDDE